MAIVQGQVAGSTAPAALLVASNDCSVNVRCVNGSTVPAQAWVEVRPGNSTQVPHNLVVPGWRVAANDRQLEGPLFLNAGDGVYAYGSSTSVTFHLDGVTV